MKFGTLGHFLSGVSLPVSSIRTGRSCGIGEFLDLVSLAEWCANVGLEVIQILPVNDTGFQTSPYSALSAFALHPIYIRLDELKGSEEFLKEIQGFRETYEKQERVAFKEVLLFKLDILERIFNSRADEIAADKDLRKWTKDNPWIKAYCAYHILKTSNEQRHWKEWKILNYPGPGEIDAYWGGNSREVLQHSWVQFELEKQFRQAACEMERLGIFLKGDIPILLTEDSADVWANRQYFIFSKRAGAPPDMFTEDGQNWGFPIYDWKAMEQDDFSFWRNRLKQAAKFYHIYRIDHVLGFFRIFCIPDKDRSGRLGFYHPFENITRSQLNDAGYHDGRVRWLSVPHIFGGEINIAVGEKSHKIRDLYLNRIGDENLFNFKPDFESELKILSLDENDLVKNQLLDWYHDRTLIEVAPCEYQKKWNYARTRAFESLTAAEKSALEALFNENDKKSEQLWERQGRKLLSMMKETTDMLMCAEDLGVVPKCVPRVLNDLGILSLKIERWVKKYEDPQTPYIPGSEYPLLSVCTPSVHDTSTIREWWENECSEMEREKYFKMLNLDMPCPREYIPGIADAIIRKNLDSNSILAVFQIQDLLSLTEELRMFYSQDERINIPGTISPENWSYRMNLPIEKLKSLQKLNNQLANLCTARKKRKLPG
jgi:4-alpha-glucanotransferase